MNFVAKHIDDDPIDVFPVDVSEFRVVEVSDCFHDQTFFKLFFCWVQAFNAYLLVNGLHLPFGPGHFRFKRLLEHGAFVSRRE